MAFALPAIGGWAAAVGTALLASLLCAGLAAVLVAVLALALGATGWNALVYVTAGERAPAGLTAQAVAIAAPVIFTTAALSAPPMGAIASTLGWLGFWSLCAGIAALGALIARGLPVDGATTDAIPG